MKKLLLTSLLTVASVTSFANSNMVDLIIEGIAPVDHAMMVEYQLAYKNSQDNKLIVDTMLNTAQLSNGKALVIVPKTHNNQAYEYAGIIVKSAFLEDASGNTLIHVHLDEKFGDQESCSYAVRTIGSHAQEERKLNIAFDLSEDSIGLSCSK